MDERLDTDARKQALAQSLEASRREAKQAKQRIQRKVNVPKRFVGSVKDHPKVWIIGAGATCLVGGTLVRSLIRPKKTSKSGSFIKGTLFSIALSLGKPYIKSFILTKAAEFVKTRAYRPQNSQTRPPAESLSDSPLGQRRDM